MDRDYQTASFDGPTTTTGKRLPANHPRLLEKRLEMEEAKVAAVGMFNRNVVDEYANMEPQDRISPLDGLRRVSQAQVNQNPYDSFNRGLNRGQSVPSFNTGNDDYGDNNGVLYTD